MTNEQAIEFFKGQKEIFGKESLMYEAIEKAIKALEQENFIDTLKDKIDEEYNSTSLILYDDDYSRILARGKEIAYINVLNMIDDYKEKSEK